MENTTNNNSNTNTNEIDTMMESVKTVFTATATHMASMTIGTRMPVKDMAEIIGKQINIEPQTVAPFVHYMAKNSKLGYVSPGRFGGFIRGERKLKTIKMTAPTPSENTTSSEDADNSNE